MSEPHPLDRAIELEVVDDEVVRGRTQPEWANMVGPFGGVTAAAIVHAIDIHPDRLGEPVALTVNFAAPIADGDFEICRRAPRTNRTNQHWIVELSQDGEVTTTATAVFGKHRDTWSDTEAVMPVVPAPHEIPRTTHTNLPTWVQMYDMRFADGSFSGGEIETGPSSASTLVGSRRRAAGDRLRGAHRFVGHLLSANLLAPGHRAVRHDLDDDVLPRRQRASRGAGRRLHPRNRARQPLRPRVLRPGRPTVGS